MKAFALLLAAACLLATVTARTVSWPWSSEDKEIDQRLRLRLALERALADIDSARTCKTCWKYFGVISKHMRTYSDVPPTDSMVRVVCQALQIYAADGDCVAFLKTAYMNLTSYMSTQLDPSRVCPTALHCKPTDQDQTMVAFGSIYEEDFNLCSVCKQWAKVIVQVIKQYAKEGLDKLKSELLLYCNKVKLVPLRMMCKAGVEALIDHIPQILKEGPIEVCKLLKAC